MQVTLKAAIISALISLTATSIGLIYEHQQLQNTNKELENRNIELQNQREELDNQANQLEELQEQTRIMRESAEKKSYVVMFATPREVGNNGEEATSAIVRGGPNGTTSIVDINTSPQTNVLRLHENQTIIVDLCQMLVRVLLICIHSI